MNKKQVWLFALVIVIFLAVFLVKYFSLTGQVISYGSTSGINTASQKVTVTTYGSAKSYSMDSSKLTKVDVSRYRNRPLYASFVAYSQSGINYYLPTPPAGYGYVVSEGILYVTAVSTDGSPQNSVPVSSGTGGTTGTTTTTTTVTTTTSTNTGSSTGVSTSPSTSTTTSTGGSGTGSSGTGTSTTGSTNVVTGTPVSCPPPCTDVCHACTGYFATEAALKACLEANFADAIGKPLVVVAGDGIGGVAIGEKRGGGRCNEVNYPYDKSKCVPSYSFTSRFSPGGAPIKPIVIRDFTVPFDLRKFILIGKRFGVFASSYSGACNANNAEIKKAMDSQSCPNGYKMVSNSLSIAAEQCTNKDRNCFNCRVKYKCEPIEQNTGQYTCNSISVSFGSI